MVDFNEPEARRAEINAFVEEATQKYIKELLPSGSVLDYTNVVMVNAAFFKGFWETKFHKTNTQRQTFHGYTEQPVEMMTVRSKFNYGLWHLRDGSIRHFTCRFYEYLFKLFFCS